jgi:phosphatidylserine/phosphatidylglycerophosphate/cardiolipin synthase-like enzyme
MGSNDKPQPPPPPPSLIPRLVFKPGAGATRRTALVRHNLETTYVVPGDWPVDGTPWFPGAIGPSQGSRAEELIEGQEAFPAMLAAMRTATKPGHFIVLLGWTLEPDFVFADGKTFMQAVEERASLGVPVRVLTFFGGKHIDQLNALRKKTLAPPATGNLDVYANADTNTRLSVGSQKGAITPLLPTLASWLHQATSLGCHHQKILVVLGNDGLIGFCGGLDIAEDRLTSLHDVHVRLTGGAAVSLWKIAEKRWEHSKSGSTPPTPPSISSLAPASFTPPSPAPQLVRVVQTVGNPDTKGVPDTLWPAVQAAIQKATQFIYIEEQYFWSLELVKELVDASKHVKHITILLAFEASSEYPGHRHRALQELVRLGGPGIEKRIGIFAHKRSRRNYVHAKMFVFDDEYAIIGSANANNRGYFVDSEVAAGIGEYGWDNVKGTRGGVWSSTEVNFARRLRIRLWSYLLALPPEEVFDGVGARVHWDQSAPSSLVTQYEAINLRDFYRQNLAHEEAFRHWEKTGRVGFDPMEPYQKAPWWQAPYEDWMPRAEDVAVRVRDMDRNGENIKKLLMPKDGGDFVDPIDPEKQHR